MAVTIVRTPWVDDDGTGTTGTVINNAVKTALYNDIDGALAKVAQLAGGNTFTGAQIINTSLQISTSTVGGKLNIGVVGGVAGAAALWLQNTDPGNNLAYAVFVNSAFGIAGTITQTGATSVLFQATSDARLKIDHGRAADLAALRGVVVHDFTWKADGVRDRGIFAQEAYDLFPRAIGKGADEINDHGQLAHPWMTDYSKFVPDLIVGWQQHDAELAELRALLTTEGL
jgi:hypothetical protein